MKTGLHEIIKKEVNKASVFMTFLNVIDMSLSHIHVCI